MSLDKAVKAGDKAKSPCCMVTLTNYHHVAKMSTLPQCSAGFYVRCERSRNSAYSFRDYLSSLEKGVQEEAEKMLMSKNSSYPFTMTELTCADVKALSEDPVFHKVMNLLLL